MEIKATSALNYKTPSKRRIWDSLEEDDFEDYASFYLGEEFSEKNLKVHFDRIDKAFKQNQKEHNKFKEGQLELEDDLREASFAF